MVSYEHLSGSDFVRMDRCQIKALSFDELQLLVLRSQRLLATALFKPVQCLFEVMPDEFVIEIFLEWLDIEELASFDRALTNHYYRDKYLSLLRDTVHKGVLSVSRKPTGSGYKFNSGVAKWLESRNIFMRALRFHDRDRDIPAKFLARTGSQLLEIEISGDLVTNNSFKSLVISCPRLETIDLGHCSILAYYHAVCPDFGVLCPGLRTLILNRTRVGDMWLAGIVVMNNRLRKVDLRQSTLTSTGLANLAKVCPGLEYVELGGCDNLTDDGVTNLAQYCPGLYYVNLSFCRKVSDKGVTELVRYCKGIRTLGLEQTPVTDEGLRMVGEIGCGALEVIVLRFNYDITDTGLSSFADGCPRLVDVSLQYCVNITKSGLSHLAQHCTHLSTLSVGGTEFAKSGDVADFRVSYPSITLSVENDFDSLD